jgi:diguanylate cyclase (GGDEF)-like protein
LSNLPAVSGIEAGDDQEFVDASRSKPLGVRRPEAGVAVYSLALLLVSVAVVLLTPGRGIAIIESPWWVALALGLAFAVSELSVFRFLFRREAIAFSLSEVPLALCLVFLAVGPAMAVRVGAGLLVIVALRRSPAYKLFFNVALFTFELAFAFLVFRELTSIWGTSDAILVVAAIVATALAGTISSVLVSIAISFFEGDLLHRITSELRLAWWLFVVNSTLAGMVLSLVLVAPTLVLLAIIPVSLLWYVIQAYGDIDQRLRDLDAVHGFTGRVGQSLDPARIGEAAVSEAARLLRSDTATVVLFDVGGAPLVRSSGVVDLELPTSPSDAAWSSLIEADVAQLVDHKRSAELGLSTNPALPDMIVASLRDQSGPLGLLLVSGRSGALHKFDGNDVARFQNLTEQLSSSLRKGMLHQRIEKEARHDGLTGLPNRTSFERSVAEAAANRSASSVLFVLMLDLDRFKEVNDTLGHHAGDDLLIEVSRRMSAQLRPGDVLARLAGDEFAVVAERDSREEMLELGRACVREAGRPVTLDGLEIVVTASAGLAVIDDDDEDAGVPLRHADIAMYNAKSQRLGVEVYRDEIDRRTPARLSMLGDLRAAIEQDQLKIHYQPKLDLASGTVIGAEALVRWTHPVRGMVPPIQFVRVAEDTGLIKQLTDLMLGRGIRTLREIQDRGYHLGLAVNLSTHDLLDTKLAERVDGHLRANGVEPGMLTLEITESSLLIDAPRARSTINELNDIGVRMSIDDFGTGYSSLSYLRRLPVVELKIDRSFVANVLLDEQDEVIVRSTIDLGHNLGLVVVAEGVENNEVLEHLRHFGCDVAQGFCISRPLAANHFVSWLATTGHPSRRTDPLDLGKWVEPPQQHDARTDTERLSD